MFKVDSIEVRWEELMTVYDGFTQLLKVINSDWVTKQSCFSNKIAICGNVANYVNKSFHIEGDEEEAERKVRTNTILNIIFTHWPKHSGNYFYPIPSAYDYGINPEKSAASNAELTYLTSLQHNRLWDYSQGSLRKSLIMFSIEYLRNILNTLEDDFVLTIHQSKR